MWCQRHQWDQDEKETTELLALHLFMLLRVSAGRACALAPKMARTPACSVCSHSEILMPHKKFLSRDQMAKTCDNGQQLRVMGAG